MSAVTLTAKESALLARIRSSRGGGCYVYGRSDVAVLLSLARKGAVSVVDNGDGGSPMMNRERWWVTMPTSPESQRA